VHSDFQDGLFIKYFVSYFLVFEASLIFSPFREVQVSPS
jgi:hypothetical protein